MKKKTSIAGIALLLLTSTSGYVLAEAKKLSLAGEYKAKNVDATIYVLQVSASKIKMAGEASWTGANPGAVNVGYLAEKEITLNPQTYTTKYVGDGCKLDIKFLPEKNQIEVAETSDPGACGGYNVTFNGTYALKKVIKAMPEIPY